MNNIEFEEFQKENGYGNAEKYRKIKDNTYKENNKKPRMFTLSDWQQQSEYYILNHVYDIGEGRFLMTETIEKHLNESLGKN